jgi:hypothetical protein
MNLHVRNKQGGMGPHAAMCADVRDDHRTGSDGGEA